MKAKSIARVDTFGFLRINYAELGRQIIEPQPLPAGVLYYYEDKSMKIKVVHCMKEKYDIYIGRPGKFGNPFTHKDGTQAKFKVATREEAVEKYREYALKNEEIMSSLGELKGKVLGCWCKNKPDTPCHGDVLVELVELVEEQE